MQIVITMPVYEDWDSAIELCQKLDLVLEKETDLRASILLIDDGSMASLPPSTLPFQPVAIERISVLSLRRNLGHQRAIAIGLTYIQQHKKGDAVVVMDADGEDRPEDLPRMIEAVRSRERPTAVFAERGKRLENPAFRTLYQCYRILHRFFIGRDIRFGNFSMLPWSHLDSLVVFPDLWNHYAAAFLNSRLPYVRVRLDRGARLRGRSHMNFVSLVVHGLSAVFANQEVVGTRLLGLVLISTMGVSLGITVSAGLGLFTHLLIPGWAVIWMGLLLVLASQALLAIFVLVFLIMMNRSHLGFLPVRDYAYFVRTEEILFQR